VDTIGKLTPIKATGLGILQSKAFGVFVDASATVRRRVVSMFAP
jgi:hypothetical protein